MYIKFRFQQPSIGMNLASFWQYNRSVALGILGLPLHGWRD
jgi:hypothetical protein